MRFFGPAFRLTVFLVVASPLTALPLNTVWRRLEAASPADTKPAPTKSAKFVPNYDESKIPEFTLPDPLIDANGERIDTRNDWESRRRETLLKFEHHVFGSMPTQRRIHTEIVRRDPTWNHGKTTRYELTVTLLPLSESNEQPDTNQPGLDLMVLIDVPSSASADNPVPAFLGLNFQGNHTVTDDPLVRISPSWVRDRRDATSRGNTPLDAGRGVASDRWPLSMINDRGYAVATLYYGDIDPDFDDGFQNGVHGLFADWIERLPADIRPGSIAGWTYGLQCVLDAIVQTPALGIDADQVAVIGHSRLGKTSLWAGAVDPRFAVIISNNSGCGGVALSRRAIGETVGRINTSFPHWFCDRFNDYNENENALPVDSHQLIALAAPRPVAIGSATEDTWADPKGEFLAGVHASPVYQLFDKPGLVDANGQSPTLMPAPNEAYPDGTITYHLRDGKHDLTEHDWKRYLDLFDRVRD
ncbi:glucuronyl esterase domain-containing protein [Neorhodopirellula pilleata]|uniref:4-O-methyl-glucuronoyl methylesterase-like domain-containing protein n=1 Tax=Neorhodopirellula pilleata TaxID=2714738 RepID=A0A5C6AR93_9BACT|nr:acetylxylan esterase [Neorhodopirellula pilleata]TWU01512.1 hypothetical protein Pla100_12470 [Neorhodopirellula pilleata]